VWGTTFSRAHTSFPLQCFSLFFDDDSPSHHNNTLPLLRSLLSLFGIDDQTKKCTCLSRFFLFVVIFRLLFFSSVFCPPPTFHSIHTPFLVALCASLLLSLKLSALVPPSLAFNLFSFCSIGYVCDAIPSCDVVRKKLALLSPLLHHPSPFLSTTF